MNKQNIYLNYNNLFYTILLFTFITILFTKPFLRYPYDMFTHLKIIDEQNITLPLQKSRDTWHFFWAQIFHFLHIQRSDIFLRASIIHYTQSISSFFMLFYFSKIAITRLFLNISPLTINYLAYWSTIIWFTVFSTASEHYHQIWILWYSINYQISLPLTFFTIGLTISLLFNDSKRIIKILLIISLNYIILHIHSMEFIYYLMYISILIFLYIDKVLLVIKKYLHIFLPFFILLIYQSTMILDYLKSYSYRQIPLLNYLSFEKLPELLKKITQEGNTIIYHYSRASSTINELIILSLVAILLFLILVIFRHYKGYPTYIRLRFLIFLFITSLFILIPTYQYTAGFASVLTYTTIAWRFYFSSLLFLILPSFIYYCFKLFKFTNLIIINIAIILIILTTYMYSQYTNTLNHNYYKNIQSIKNSLTQKDFGFNLSTKQIQIIGSKINNYESKNNSKKPLYYYARDDIAFVIKFIYRKPVFYSRRGTHNYIKSYQNHKIKRYTPILFNVPENFPPYQPFM